MRLQILDSANFRVIEFFTDPTSNALETSGTKKLRIFEIVYGGTWKVYDFNDNTFKTSTPTTEFGSLTHKTAGGVNTGIWESGAITYTVFTADSDYIFQFENVDDGTFSAYDIKYKGSSVWTTVNDVGTAAANKIADHILRRSLASALSSSDGDTKAFRSLAGATSKLVNKIAIAGTDLTIFETDDSTSLGTQALTTDSTADPITALDTA